MIQKSYDGKPTLYIVPTPIGNLNDITNRAIEVLSNVDYIFAEDTRTSGILLKHLNIKSNLIACHKFNEDTAKIKALQLLESGKTIALITDQGTPLISDPGYLTAKEIMMHGYNVVALPGATAFVPALNMSGLPSDRFLFYSFLNSKDSIAKKELEDLKTNEYTMIFYEAPHRLERTLLLLLNILGNREISISREISKVYESVYRGNINQAIIEQKSVKGEIVIVVSGNYFPGNNYEIESLIKEINYLVKSGMKESEAIKYIASKNDVSKNMLYNEYQRGAR